MPSWRERIRVHVKGEADAKRPHSMEQNREVLVPYEERPHADEWYEACAAVATIAYAKEIEDEANDVSDVSKCVQSEAIADDPSVPIFIQGTPDTGVRTFATSLSAEEYELSV